MDPIPRRGRASALNPPNRYERLHVERAAEDFEDDERRSIETQFLRDASRTILAKNDSPDVPFTYSLNPYRGCEHGCVYCMDGSTAVLLPDSSTRPLAELKPGDEIVGTLRSGHYRRFVSTRVLAHWKTRKPGYRITLEDGTILIASADHRFLTERGWKYVTGAMNGRHRRPYLTTGNSLMGVGIRPFAEPPLSERDFNMGYLCGMVRGDGHLGSYSYDRPGRSNGDQHRFRLALCDIEPLDRTAAMLAREGIAVDRFVYLAQTEERKEMLAIRTSSRRSVEAIRQLIEWPDRPSREWDRGFLSGIFDAEGSFSQTVLRIANKDPNILNRTQAGLQRFGFDTVLDRTGRGVHYVRVRGGLGEHLRFFNWVNPAMSRRRSIIGQAVKTDARLRVVAIEPLGGENDLYDITTGTGDFIANGVISHNCYARPSHEYLGFSAGLDFETRILVKDRAPELLAMQFEKKAWVPQVVALSGNTDPYQPVERRLGITRRCLETFLRYRNPVSIITKNHLVTRDLDILAEMASMRLVHVTLSVTSLDADLIGRMEPRTSRPPRRLDAIEALAKAGVPVGVNVAPVVPGLTDEEMPAILEAVAARGATHASYLVMRLPGPVEPIFLEWLERHYPHRVDRVVGRLKSLRGGELSDSRFGTRMRGEGPWASVFSRLFRITTRNLGLNRPFEPLETGLFRRPGLGGQGELF